MTIKTEQGFRGYWTATKGNKVVVARHYSLSLLEQELKALGFTEHRVKFYKGGERVYAL